MNTSSSTTADSGDVVRAVSGGRRGWFVRSFAGPSAAGFLQSLDGLMADGKVLKRGRTAQVVRNAWNGRSIVIKRYNFKGALHSLRFTVKGSRARHCWAMGRHLAALKIATAEPLAMIEERVCGILRCSYIVNAFVEGPHLNAVMHGADYSEQEKKDVVAAVERTLEELGRHRLTHSDMKPINWLVCEGRPVLIDLDSMRRHRIAPYFQLRYTRMVRQFHRRLYEQYGGGPC